MRKRPVYKFEYIKTGVVFLACTKEEARQYFGLTHAQAKHFLLQHLVRPCYD